MCWIKKQSGFNLSNRSRTKLKGVHPDLVAVVELAIKITEIDFRVLEGVRTYERQRMLYEAGASKTMNSRHLTGHAVDLGALMNGKISWDWPLYHKIADAMKKAAEIKGVAIDWGGDWKSFPDGPHFELDWNVYK